MLLDFQRSRCRGGSELSGIHPLHGLWKDYCICTWIGSRLIAAIDRALPSR